MPLILIEHEEVFIFSCYQIYKVVQRCHFYTNIAYGNTEHGLSNTISDDSCT